MGSVDSICFVVHVLHRCVFYQKCCNLPMTSEECWVCSSLSVEQDSACFKVLFSSVYRFRLGMVKTYLSQFLITAPFMPIRTGKMCFSLLLGASSCQMVMLLLAPCKLGVVPKRKSNPILHHYRHLILIKPHPMSLKLIMFL